jgi:DNA-binding NtrC family response regulator
MMVRVAVLDDDEDLLDSLSDLLGTLGNADCVCLRSVAELTGRREAVLSCDLALLDINLGPGRPSGLDAYRWLREQDFGGRIVFLTGHARSHPLVAQARGFGNVLEKPVDVDALLLLVGK